MGLVGGGLYPNAAYQTSKAGLVNLTRTLALEWASRGIRVNAVAPAFVRTRLTEGLLTDETLGKAILAATPMGRLAEPEEVADAVAFLASDAALMITGVTLPVDGGWVAQ
jgi:NAD(P)-dependent dehydrogenase (short-subunit alcohol dehydrogenase family)